MKLLTAIKDALRGRKKTKEQIADMIECVVLEDACVVLFYRIRNSGKIGCAAAMEIFDLKLAEITEKRRISELRDALASARYLASAYDSPQACIMADKISEKLAKLKQTGTDPVDTDSAMNKY